MTDLIPEMASQTSFDSSPMEDDHTVLEEQDHTVVVLDDPIPSKREDHDSGEPTQVTETASLEPSNGGGQKKSASLNHPVATDPFGHLNGAVEPAANGRAGEWMNGRDVVLVSAATTAAATTIPCANDKEDSASSGANNAVVEYPSGGDDHGGGFPQGSIGVRDVSAETNATRPDEPAHQAQPNVEMAQAPLQNADDEFGDFGSAVQQDDAEPMASPGECRETVVAVSSQDDHVEGLGGAVDSALLSFESGQSAGSRALNDSASVVSNEGDDFGDFGVARARENATAAFIETEPLDQVQEPIANKAQSEDDDAFGGLGSAEQVDDAPDHVNDDFGGFGAAEPVTLSVSEPEQTSTGTLGEPNDEDDFGGFGGAQIATTAVDELQYDDIVTPDELNADDDFRGFDNAQAATTSVGEPQYDDIDTPDEPNDDDDFGGFDRAQITTTSFGEPQEADINAPDEPNDDDDFGSFDGTQAATTSVGEPQEADINAPDEPNDDDDFGGIDGAQAAMTSVNEQQEADIDTPDEPNEDDDFGSFDAVETDIPNQLEEDSDFGGFDGAEVATLPFSEPQEADIDTPDEVNDYGGFGGAQAATTPANEQQEADIDTTDEPNEDDDFGSFDAVETDIPNQVEEDNDFGGFDGAEVATPPFSEPQEAGIDTPDEVNDFGGFGGAQVTTTPVNEQQEAYIDTPDEPNEDDDFGSFDAVETDIPNQLEEDNDFGDFDGAEVATPPFSEPQEAGIDTTDELNEDNNFGGFDGAEVATMSANKFQESDIATPDELNEDDDFGSFDAVNTDIPNQLEEDDDDFGDFGGAEASTTPFSEHQEANAGIADAAIGNDDAFGYFDVADNASRNGSEKNEGDFGGFDGIDAATTPLSEPQDAGIDTPDESNEDDGFGGAKVATSKSQEGIPVASSNDKNEDDNFGDFDGAEVAAMPASDPQPANVEIPADGAEEDDDFGDFGGSEVAHEVDESVPASQDDAGEFDDFGDFGGAAEAPVDANERATLSQDQDDDFGDFGDEAETVTAEDVLLSRLRSDLPTLFAQYSHDKATLEDDSGSGQPKSEVVTVESILSTATERRNESDSNTSESTDLSKVLRDTSMLKQGAPRSIIVNGGDGAYAHFAFPIGGLSRSSASFSRTKAKTGISRLHLPDVLPIRLQVAAETPVDMASPESSPRHVIAAATTSALVATVVGLPPAATVVKVPPAKPKDTEKETRPSPPIQADSSKKAGQGPSEYVRQFLRQIPDFSFMLSSNLSIPQSKQ